MILAMGLAPLITSNPNSKIFDLAFSLTFKEMFFSSKIDSNSIKNLSTTFIEFCLLNIAKFTTASNLFLNSGLKNFLTAFSLSFSTLSPKKPTFSLIKSSAPMLLVIIKITFVKSTFFPKWSVSFP